jgi:transcriptional regulator with XRE-family HTH domain
MSGAVGERIAAYRRRRGLSQAALAGLVGRSESWLSQVERGVRSVDRLSVLVGHTSPELIRSTYGHLIGTIGRRAAEATASLVPRRQASAG